VVTDHSPSTADLKGSGDFAADWGGIASLQVGLSAVWTTARDRGTPLADVVGWMSTAPAARVGLTGKGEIAVGADADLCVFAPDEELVVDVARLHHKNPVSAYAGRTLTGTVRQTWLRGTPIDLSAAPRGRLLRRTDVTEVGR
jgi:allantoinase